MEPLKKSMVTSKIELHGWTSAVTLISTWPFDRFHMRDPGCKAFSWINQESKLQCAIGKESNVISASPSDRWWKMCLSSFYCHFWCKFLTFMDIQLENTKLVTKKQYQPGRAIHAFNAKSVTARELDKSIQYLGIIPFAFFFLHIMSCHNCQNS